MVQQDKPDMVLSGTRIQPHGINPYPGRFLSSHTREEFCLVNGMFTHMRDDRRHVGISILEMVMIMDELHDLAVLRLRVEERVRRYAGSNRCRDTSQVLQATIALDALALETIRDLVGQLHTNDLSPEVLATVSQVLTVVDLTLDPVTLPTEPGLSATEAGSQTADR